MSTGTLWAQEAGGWLLHVRLRAASSWGGSPVLERSASRRQVDAEQGEGEADAVSRARQEDVETGGPNSSPVSANFRDRINAWPPL